MSELFSDKETGLLRDAAGRPLPGQESRIGGVAAIARIGRRLFSEHLVGGNFGNISYRDSQSEGFYITSSGSYLDEPEDLVFVPLDGEVPRNASSEWRVHREIYARTRHMAVVHAHPPCCVACSLFFDELIPLDSEGEALCPVIPVVAGKPGSIDLAERVTECLHLSNLCIVKGHGTFAGGKNLDEAYLYTSLAEYSCHVTWMAQNFRNITT